MAPPASFFLRATNGLLLACGVALAAVGGYQLTGGDAELPEVPYLGAWSGPLLLAVGGSVTLLAAVGCCAAARHGAATWAYLLALQALYTALVGAAAACAMNYPRVAEYVITECEKLGGCPSGDVAELTADMQAHLKLAASAAGGLAGFLILSQAAAVASALSSKRALYSEIPTSAFRGGAAQFTTA